LLPVLQEINNYGGNFTSAFVCRAVIDEIDCCADAGDVSLAGRADRIRAALRRGHWPQDPNAFNAYSFEAANPRHEHEWRVLQKVKLPDGKILIPGAVTYSNVMIEHPEVVVDRIEGWARLAGRENVIFGNRPIPEQSQHDRSPNCKGRR
jgi:methionine synthase II (cobalamin-independent)